MRYNKLSLFFLLFLVACNTPKGNKQNAKTETSIPASDAGIALKFINAYVAFCNASDTSKNTMDWIASNEMLTDNFKKAYKSLVDAALKKDPELGLDFDPVFDAQDYPEEGFTLVDVDKNTGYVTLAGKDWQESTLVLRVAQQDNKWLVDGAGVINIPEDKRAER